MYTWESCTSILTRSSSSILDDKFHNKTLPCLSGPLTYAFGHSFYTFSIRPGRQKQTKVRSFCFDCYFWASSFKPFVHTHCFLVHPLPYEKATHTAFITKRPRLARCGRERSRIKRQGHGVVSGHWWLAGCADGCLLESCLQGRWKSTA